MKTIKINGKEYTENEFNNQVDSEDIFFEGFHNCEDAEDLKQFIFQGLRDEFPRQQPEPPTLRPMSELPEVNEWVNVLIQHNDDLFWGDGCICLNRIELRYLGQDCWKNKNYISEEKVKALGWLPKEVLPNPNEIKLPC